MAIAAAAAAIDDPGMAKRLLALLVAAAPAFAQTVQDVLPRGLLLDAAGKLQWLEAEPLGCARAGGPADTLRYATLGVAIGQQLNRCKGYYGATEVEAGEVDCRLIRARVFLDRFQWDSAEKVLLLARALTERSGYMGWKQRLASLEAELRAGRRK
jgi:hypothetical protein